VRSFQPQACEWPVTAVDTWITPVGPECKSNHGGACLASLICRLRSQANHVGIAATAKMRANDMALPDLNRVARLGILIAFATIVPTIAQTAPSRTTQLKASPSVP
jgi:hypothetical protein